MKNIVVVANLAAHPGKEAQLRDALSALVAIVKREPGCIRYDLHEAIDTPGQFVFYEIWEDDERLDVHNGTEDMKAFVAKAGSWIKTISVVKYQHIS